MASAPLDIGQAQAVIHRFGAFLESHPNSLPAPFIDGTSLRDTPGDILDALMLATCVFAASGEEDEVRRLRAAGSLFACVVFGEEAATLRQMGVTLVSVPANLLNPDGTANAEVALAAAHAIKAGLPRASHEAALQKREALYSEALEASYRAGLEERAKRDAALQSNRSLPSKPAFKQPEPPKTAFGRAVNLLFGLIVLGGMVFLMLAPFGVFGHFDW